MTKQLTTASRDTMTVKERALRIARPSEELSELEMAQPIEPALTGQFDRRHRSTREVQRRNDATVLLLESVEVVYRLAGARIAHLNAMSLEEPPRLR